MLTPDIETALNRQFNYERSAAQDYLALAAYFEHRSLKGFAAFMRRQSEEEMLHAMKLFDYIFDRGGRVQIDALAAPTQEFASTRAAFAAALAREQANTKAIHELNTLAGDAGDYATQAMLQWFIAEQVEEEQWAQEALDLLDVAGDDPGALLMLDQRYGTPTPGTEASA